MKKSLLIAFVSNLAVSGVTAQSYTTGFDNATQQAGWQEFKKGTILQTEHWNYQNAQAFSAPDCLVHLYPVGGTEPTDNWFVSPAFSIEEGGMLDSLRYAFSGFGTPQSGDTVFIYLLNGNADPALATTSSILYQFSGANYANDNTWRLLAPITLPAQTGNSYIAFRYKTIVNWLDVRFDNLALSGASFAGIDDQQLAAMNIYPNPANNELNLTFQLETPGEVAIVLRSLDGKVLLEESRYAGSGPQYVPLQVPVSVANGIMLVEITTGNTTVVRKVSVLRN